MKAYAAKLRLAVVGVGARSMAIGRVMDRARGRIVAVVDPTTAGRARGRSWFGSDVATFTDVARLIRVGPPVDAAFVTSPDDTHAAIATELLKAGVATYLEKPMAISIDDADEILTVGAATSTPLYVGHNMRHMAVIRTMYDIIARGEIGEVKAVWCRHFVGNGGDYYFKDWHADRTRTAGLLLQKGAHDIDIVHYLSGAYSDLVSGMGALTLYGDVSGRADNSGRLMPDWFSLDNWPPRAQTMLNRVVDVEDLSMVHMRLTNGVFASYEQCHYTPDYWRNYTVIGTDGRLENFGDGEGSMVCVWNRRVLHQPGGDRQYPIHGDARGHDDADVRTVTEFLDFVTTGAATVTSPIASRNAVAAGLAATQSIRSGSLPMHVQPVDRALETYFESRVGREDT